MGLGGTAAAQIPAADPATGSPYAAEPTAPVAVQSPAATPAVCPPAADGALCIAALTPVRLVIRTHLGSKISTSGEWFEIELAEPIMADGKEAIPAGTRGQGEVVHAKKSGGSGASGELVLAARFLDVGGRHLRLRSMHFAAAGEDRIGTVNTLNVASAASPIPGLSLIGFFVKGKGIDLPEGTLAEAKTAEPFVFAPDSAAPPAPPPALDADKPATTPQDGEKHDKT